MNPASAFARVLVDELVRGGVTDAVLAPGSRSAPVALALAEAERSGRLVLHVRIDERTAGFLALGLAKASGRPVPVLTTSGTAAAHLHAAVLEADASGVPLLALTADRPPELRATGANQAIEQVDLYGGAVRWALDVAAPESGREEAQNRYWRSVTARAVLVARGALSADPGPVQLNLSLREPLLPEDGMPAEPTGPWSGRPGGGPWTAADPLPQSTPPAEQGPPRTLVVVGDAPAGLGRAAAALADRCGWPVVAEPVSGAWGAADGLRGGSLLLGAGGWSTRHRPDRVLVVGRPTLSRSVSALLADPALRVDLAAGAPTWADAARGGSRVRLGLPTGPEEGIDTGWATPWRNAAAAVGAAVDDELDAFPALTAARLARDVVAALPAGALLVLGSSTPVRDVERVAVPRADVMVLANRGVAGIDGTLSTAIGAARVHQRSGGGPAVALMGDLTFLHDLTGLLLGEGEPAPDLVVVVPDNDGGGIFAQLEHGAPRHARDYRRVFGTPHGRDLVAVARALGWAAVRASTPAEFRRALDDALAAGGPRVVVVPTDQRTEADLVRRLQEAAGRALG